MLYVGLLSTEKIVDSYENHHIQKSNLLSHINTTYFLIFLRIYLRVF